MLSALLDTTLRRGWLPALLVAGHLFASFVLGAYEAWPPLDMPMHLVGGMVAAWFVEGVLESQQRPTSTSALRHALVLLALTAAAALTWELVENTADHLFAARQQLGLRDTTKDLVLGVVGGMVYVTLTGRGARASRPGPAR